MRKCNKSFLSFAILLVLVISFSLSSVVGAMEKPRGFPNRPITIIVPYGAGGGSDQVARAMATALEKVVKVPITVVNKPGGGGVAAFPDFFAARADGYTLLEQTDVAPTCFAAGDIKENPAVDFFPICIAQLTFSQIYVRNDDDRFPNWDIFLRLAKQKPGDITMANIGLQGSLEPVTMYLLEKELGFKVNQISFDKPVERYASLVGKHVDSLLEQPGDVRAYIDSKDMRPILTFLKERPKAFADAACLTDIGSTMEPLLRFRGFFARKGVPQDRLKYLEWAFYEAWKTEPYQKFNRSKYMHLIDSYRNIQDGIKLIEDTVNSYIPVYKELGIGMYKK